MRIPRIFTDQPLNIASEIQLEEAASAHLSRVLRLQQGYPVRLFNGTGGEYACVISRIEKRHVTLTPDQFLPENNESPLRLHVVVGVSKGEKMDLIIQKCTELGATSFQPLTTAHGDVRMDMQRWQKKQEHWRGVAISACEQSGKNLLPVIHPVLDFHTWLNQPGPNGGRYLFHPGGSARLSGITAQTDVVLCFGCEGGFSTEEVTTAEKAGVTITALGKRILRAETAPIAVVAALQAIQGDLG